MSLDDDGEGREGPKQPTFSLLLVDVDEWLSFWMVEHEASMYVDWLMSSIKVPISSLL